MGFHKAMLHEKSVFEPFGSRIYMRNRTFNATILIRKLTLVTGLSFGVPDSAWIYSYHALKKVE